MTQSFHPPARTLMGYASNRKNVLFCLGALEAVLNRSGGVAEARLVYSTL